MGKRAAAQQARRLQRSDFSREPNDPRKGEFEIRTTTRGGCGKWHDLPQRSQRAPTQHRNNGPHRAMFVVLRQETYPEYAERCRLCGRKGRDKFYASVHDKKAASTNLASATLRLHYGRVQVVAGPEGRRQLSNTARLLDRDDNAIHHNVLP